MNNPVVVLGTARTPLGGLLGDLSSLGGSAAGSGGDRGGGRPQRARSSGGR